jgi:hypothetical protein
MKKFKILLVILLIPQIIILQSCATMFKGNSSKVEVSSEPSGATLYVNGNQMGKTPGILKLESKNNYQIEIRKEGYETRTFNITNSVAGGYVVLDILFGIVPIIIDVATGSWYVLDQDHVNAVLEKKN